MSDLENNIEEQITSFFSQNNFEKSRRFVKEGYSNKPLKQFLQKLHFPQKKYSTIHIAGTVAKGSSALFLAQLLQTRYKRVGLYTSPHVYSLKERFKINEKNITEAELFALWQNIKKHEELKRLSYFDALTAMAFLWFAQEQADVAVIETGLGGRLDSTNVLEPLFTVLTPIALDHQNILGNTLKEIVLEKAGILHATAPNYSFGQSEEAEKIIEQYCKQHKIENIFIDKIRETKDTKETKNSKKYQSSIEKGDYLTANRLAVTNIFEHFYKEKVNENFFKNNNLSMPAGRMEWLAPNFLFDSAHNEAAVDVLSNWLLQHGKKNNWIVFMNFMKERNFEELVSPLQKLNGKINCKFYLLQTNLVEGSFYSFADIKALKNFSFEINLFSFSQNTNLKKELVALEKNFFFTASDTRTKASLQKSKKTKPLKMNFLFFGTMRFYKLLKDSLT